MASRVGFGLDRIGKVTTFESAHIARNYILDEMVHIVGRKHSQKLRMISTILLDPVTALPMRAEFQTELNAALEQAKKEIARMAEIARRSVWMSTCAFFTRDRASFDKVRELEEGIDNLQREITHYLVELAERNMTEIESEQLPVLLHTVNDLERIGDQEGFLGGFMS